MARPSGNAERPLFGDERSLIVVGLDMIQITVNEGRTIELKNALYKAIAEGLQKLAGLKPQDVFISLVEVKRKTGRSGTAWRSSLIDVLRTRRAE